MLSFCVVCLAGVSREGLSHSLGNQVFIGLHIGPSVENDAFDKRLSISHPCSMHTEEHSARNENAFISMRMINSTHTKNTLPHQTHSHIHTHPHYTHA